jgi:hypothetical protein
MLSTRSAGLSPPRSVICSPWHVAPKQEPVSSLVFAPVAIGPDMRGFERRQGPLMRDRAAPTVDVRHEHLERALPKARPDELRLAEPCLCFGHAGETWPVQPVVHRVPKRKPVRVAGKYQLMEVHAPDGEPLEWWQRLNKALGNIERLCERFAVSNSVCISFTLGRNFGTLNERCPGDDRGRCAQGRD